MKMLREKRSVCSKHGVSFGSENAIQISLLARFDAPAFRDKVLWSLLEEQWAHPGRSEPSAHGWQRSIGLPEADVSPTTGRSALEEMEFGSVQCRWEGNGPAFSAWSLPPCGATSGRLQAWWLQCRARHSIKSPDP